MLTTTKSYSLFAVAVGAVLVFSSPTEARLFGRRAERKAARQQIQLPAGVGTNQCIDADGNGIHDVTGQPCGPASGSGPVQPAEFGPYVAACINPGQTQFSQSMPSTPQVQVVEEPSQEPNLQSALEQLQAAQDAVEAAALAEQQDARRTAAELRDNLELENLQRAKQIRNLQEQLRALDERAALRLRAGSLPTLIEEPPAAEPLEEDDVCEDCGDEE
jgi:molybdopterin-biosynthesis enzyme MoeA-like protein